jgi:hypothetical protein
MAASQYCKESLHSDWFLFYRCLYQGHSMNPILKKPETGNLERET